MAKRVTVISVFVSLLMTGCSIIKITNQPKKADKPNIVLVITDDQGYGDVALHGNPIIQTPNIDKLGQESIRLTDYHVSPTCSPTRAALLTGNWSNRTGVWHTIKGRSMLRTQEVTLAELLKKNGYDTALFGKWHLGDNYPYRPMDQGFDLAFYHGGGGVGQTPDFWDNAYFDGSYYRNGVAEPVKGYVTDVIFDEAIKYIDEVKDKSKPFFAYISTNAPHGPMHAPQRYADMYKDHDLNVLRQHFFGMITNIDDNIAKLRRYLKTNDLEDNTIFIFTTDNGTAAGNAVYNAGMRGVKSSQYDGGHRVPFFIRWPDGGLAEENKIDDLTAHIDIVPTLLSLTNSQSFGEKFDGKDLTSLFYHGDKSLTDRIVVTDSQRVIDPIKWRKSAVMKNKWRLIDGKALYNIDSDPGQRSDVAHLHPEIVKELTEFYNQYWQELEPTFAEKTPIYIGSKQENPAKLTGHDWLGNGFPVPWNQAGVRSLVKPKKKHFKGYWQVNAVTSGNYKFELRRWPEETNLPINSELKAGAPVTGVTAYREKPGKSLKAVKAILVIDGKSYITDVTDMDKKSNFEVSLTEGVKNVSAKFVTADGQEVGAYYLYVSI